MRPKTSRGIQVELIHQNRLDIIALLNMSRLPLDVYIHILSHLRASRTLDDGSTGALISCLQVNSLLREAAMITSIWECHYKARYLHCDEEMERSRKHKHKEDWRLMYLERRQLDKRAMQLLDEIVECRVDRNDRAADLASLKMDVWDVLDLVYCQPIPGFSQEGSRVSFNTNPRNRSVTKHTLTRRYWAKSMVNILSRSYALDVWRDLDLDLNAPSPPEPSFEVTMNTLSCFFGIPPLKITEYFDNLAVDCRHYLQVSRICLDPEDLGFDLPNLCRSICRFMFNNGFGPSNAEQFRDMMNHFPHAYISTRKKTLPICLVHVFVSVSRRLGLNASPINFPGIVLAHVSATSRETSDVVINVFEADPSQCIVDIQHTILLQLPIPANTIQENLVPCKSSPMLLRASRNILSAYREAGELTHEISQASMLAACCIHSLFQTDTQLISHILMNLDLDPVDYAVFLVGKLAPLLRGRFRTIIEEHCMPILKANKKVSSTVNLRRAEKPVKYFCGMIFKHIRYDYWGCITGWDETCKASADWIIQMNVNSLDRGANQPFYSSVSLDDTRRYVAEENIEPVLLSQELVSHFWENVHDMSLYFEDVELHLNNLDIPERGRMVLSPESRVAYPDDDAVGARWVNDGTFPC